MANVKALHTSLGSNEIPFTFTIWVSVSLVEEGLACNRVLVIILSLHQKEVSLVNFTISPTKEGREWADWCEGL